MAFRIQHTDSGLFWGVNSNGRITLGDIYQSSVYDLSCPEHIKNIKTGKCLCKSKQHLVESEHDGLATDFNFAVNFGNGEIVNYAQNFDIIYNNGAVDISRSKPTQWSIVTVEAEPEVEDVPVARAAALIEEALNAAPEPEEEEEVPELEAAPEVAPEVAPEADEEN